MTMTMSPTPLTPFRVNLRGALIQHGANLGRCLTYEETAFLIGRPGMLGHHLAYPLGDVSRDCFRRGEPLLSSIVVSEHSEEPGEGFWVMVDGLYRVPPYDRREFLANMQQAVFRYWHSILYPL